MTFCLVSFVFLCLFCQNASDRTVKTMVRASSTLFPKTLPCWSSLLGVPRPRPWRSSCGTGPTPKRATQVGGAWCEEGGPGWQRESLRPIRETTRWRTTMGTCCPVAPSLFVVRGSRGWQIVQFLFIYNCRIILICHPFLFICHSLKPSCFPPSFTSPLTPMQATPSISHASLRSL